MLSQELKKLKEQLEAGKESINIDKEKLLEELTDLENMQEYMQESLSLSSKVCPTCGKRI